MKKKVTNITEEEDQRELVMVAAIFTLGLCVCSSIWLISEILEAANKIAETTLNPVLLVPILIIGLGYIYKKGRQNELKS